MWCARWFMPLLILPLPTAPPYFLAVFLVSLFLHARPCFYCMVLLIALLSSSCYWQAVPVDAPLTRPLGNATTFRDAIRANVSSPNVEIPPVVQLVDRCWCNVFSRSGLFEPSDVNEWEQASVVRIQRMLEAQDVRVEEKGVGEVENEARSEVVSEEQESGTQSAPAGVSFSLRGLRDIFFPTMETSTPVPKYRLKHASSPTLPVVAHVIETPSEPLPEPTTSPTEATAESQHIDSSTHVANTQPSSGEPAELLRGYYDLRPYGLDVTVDLHWNR